MDEGPWLTDRIAENFHNIYKKNRQKCQIKILWFFKQWSENMQASMKKLKWLFLMFLPTDFNEKTRKKFWTENGENFRNGLNF